MAVRWRGCGCAPDLLLVDGLQTPPTDHPARAIVRGDGTSAAIAAASVVAKVLRDRVMAGLGPPPTRVTASPPTRVTGRRQHRDSPCSSLGPCPLHRASFKPVASLRQSDLWNGSC
jgi:ribonuclease HII